MMYAVVRFLESIASAMTLLQTSSLSLTMRTLVRDSLSVLSLLLNIQQSIRDFSP
jgi:hypothetical protein